MVTEARKRANKNWSEKNREQSNYIKSRSSAKSFIKNKSTLEDLKIFEEIIRERRELLLADESNK